MKFENFSNKRSHRVIFPQYVNFVTKWPRAYVNGLQAHLGNNCNKCPIEIQQYWLGFVAAKGIIDSDNATYTHKTKSKKRKAQSQPGIEDFYESRDLPKSNVASINKALARAFVNCGMSFFH